MHLQHVFQGPLHRILSLCSALHTPVSSKEVNVKSSSVTHDYRSRNGL